MSRVAILLVAALALAPAAPSRAEGQVARPAIGAGIGVAGGAVITLGVVVARARMQREYLDSVEDLIHWQSTPMIAAPLTGIMFGLAGKDALVGSIVGSTGGMVLGAAAGAGVGWLISEYQEGPWAGGVIGAAVGMTVGGLTLGLRAWSRDEDPDLEYPGFLRFNFSVPVP